ncbi:MAG: hypothetical protein NC320_12870 [Clostridium sp.]|nr:hypothetical protein [Clostridium sp.]MCM1548286.1 hypothetical protein [Ruminococcus sp.]
MNKFDPAKVNELLNIAGKKLNIPPGELKKQLESGKFDSAMKNMSKSDAAKLDAAIKNPKLVEKMLSAPQAKSLYNKITGVK